MAEAADKIRSRVQSLVSVFRSHLSSLVSSSRHSDAATVDYLLWRRRISELRSNYMYFYTDLAKPFGRKGLLGVNIHNGVDSRFILDSDPDEQFVTDETVNLLYSADGNKLQAFDILKR